MDTSTILQEAALLIEKDGWWGKSIPEDTRKARCALTAMMSAANKHGMRALPAVKALSMSLGLNNIHGDDTAVIFWNDTPGRTAEEVINALRTAAAATSHAPAGT